MNDNAGADRDALRVNRPSESRANGERRKYQFSLRDLLLTLLLASILCGVVDRHLHSIWATRALQPEFDARREVTLQVLNDASFAPQDSEGRYPLSWSSTWDTGSPTTRRWRISTGNRRSGRPTSMDLEVTINLENERIFPIVVNASKDAGNQGFLDALEAEYKRHGWEYEIRRDKGAKFE